MLSYTYSCCVKCSGT